MCLNCDSRIQKWLMTKLKTFSIVQLNCYHKSRYVEKLPSTVSRSTRHISIIALLINEAIMSNITHSLSIQSARNTGIQNDCLLHCNAFNWSRMNEIQMQFNKVKIEVLLVRHIVYCVHCVFCKGHMKIHRPTTTDNRPPTLNIWFPSLSFLLGQ